MDTLGAQDHHYRIKKWLNTISNTCYCLMYIKAMESCVGIGSDVYCAQLSVCTVLFVFTISAMISLLQRTHVSVVVKDSIIRCDPHTLKHTFFCWCHCLVCVEPQTLQQCWVSELYLSQPSLCCSSYNSKVTHTRGSEKIIFHVFGVSYRELWWYVLACIRDSLNQNNGNLNK